MNDVIAEYYRERVELLEWTDSNGGLVRPISVKKDVGNGKFITKTFPVACDITYEMCDGSPDTLRMFAPDSKKRCVIYFEDKGIGEETVDGKKKMVSNLRLVCWMNLNRFSNAGCSLSFYAISSLLKNVFDQRPVNFQSIVQGLQCVSTTIPKKGAEIFSQYTYNEYRQYLLKPFDYFAIDIKTYFTVNNDCLPELIPTDDECS